MDDQQGEMGRRRQHPLLQRLPYSCLFALYRDIRLAQDISQSADSKQLGYLLHVSKSLVKRSLLDRDIEDRPCVAACNRSLKHYCCFIPLALTNSSTKRWLSLVSTDLLMTMLAALMESSTTRRLSSARARAASCWIRAICCCSIFAARALASSWIRLASLSASFAAWAMVSCA